MKYHLLFLSLLCLFSCKKEQKPQDLKQILEQLPYATVKTISPSNSLYKEMYEILLEQPIDHKHPKKGSFQQRIYLSHLGFDRPMILETEGYAAGFEYKPLSKLLNANQIIVEHRFMGESKPDSIQWEYLNIRQAAADHHRIVKLFKPFYKKAWINAGWSKGGQTAMFHRRFYPNDVVGTVAFDSPLNLEQQDRRIDAFFEQVGTPECQQKLIDFQQLVMKQKKEVLRWLITYSEKEGRTFEKLTPEGALEYMVLEYPFSFWQYKKIPCHMIPDSSSYPLKIFNHLRNVVGTYSYSDAAYESASMYQFHTELGYYGYVTKHIADSLVVAPKNANNLQFAPQAERIKFKPNVMRDIKSWIQRKGNNMLFIYGGLDPWSAPAVQLNGRTNAVKMVLPKGNHYTFIKEFPKEEQQKILDLLNSWIKE